MRRKSKRATVTTLIVAGALVIALLLAGTILRMHTHEMSFARDVSDHIVFMDGGAIIEQGGSGIITNPTQERTIQFLKRFAQ